METSHICPEAYSLNAYMTVKDCADAIDFYKKTFGATENSRILMPNGLIEHAEIEIEGSLLMMSDEIDEWRNKSPTTLGDNPVTFSLYVKDVDTTFHKALATGCKVVRPLKNMFYGDRVGQIMDPFGYRWMISTHIKIR